MHVVIAVESSPMMVGFPVSQFNDGLGAYLSRLKGRTEAKDVRVSLIRFSTKANGVKEVSGSGQRVHELRENSLAVQVASNEERPSFNRLAPQQSWPDYSGAIEAILSSVALFDGKALVVTCSTLRSSSDAQTQIANLAKVPATSCLQLFMDSVDPMAPGKLPKRTIDLVGKIEDSVKGGATLPRACNDNSMSVDRFGNAKQRIEALEREKERSEGEKTFGVPTIANGHQFVLRGAMFLEFFDWLFRQTLNNVGGGATAPEIMIDDSLRGCTWQASSPETV